MSKVRTYYPEGYYAQNTGGRIRAFIYTKQFYFALFRRTSKVVALVHPHAHLALSHRILYLHRFSISSLTLSQLSLYHICHFISPFSFFCRSKYVWAPTRTGSTPTRGRGLPSSPSAAGRNCSLSHSAIVGTCTSWGEGGESKRDTDVVKNYFVREFGF